MFATLSLFFALLINDGSYYKTSAGKVTFESNASLEKIVATSHELKGIISPETNQFSFSVELESFHGFNSHLQKEHYKENYVESDKYPKALFTGKIIEEIDFNKPGIYNVRAKGSFALHGYAFTKIFNSKLTVVNNTQLKIEAGFQLSLKEFNIKVPRLVHKKIAESIKVNVELVMNKQ